MSPKNEAQDDGGEEFEISFGEKTIKCERHGTQNDDALIFTHGAGGGIADGATSGFARGYAVKSSVITYQGNLNLKSRTRMFHTVIQNEDHHPVVLGGRSMGARAAVLTALEQEQKVKALVLVSYPLVAGGKGGQREPEKREQILLDLPADVEVLFIIGREDSQCPLDQLSEIRAGMKARSWLVIVEGADHGMNQKPKKATELMRRETGLLAAEWMEHHSDARRECSVWWDLEQENVVRGKWE